MLCNSMSAPISFTLLPAHALSKTLDTMTESASPVHCATTLRDNSSSSKSKFLIFCLFFELFRNDFCVTSANLLSSSTEVFGATLAFRSLLLCSWSFVEVFSQYSNHQTQPYIDRNVNQHNERTLMQYP